jgi:hypothetical protein
MNYTSCYTLFTAGQKSRILAFAASPYRKSLTTSLAISASYPIGSYSFPIAASCTPATSATGLSGSYAGILSVDLNNRTVGSSIAMYDNGYVNGTASCLNLIPLIKGNTYTFIANVAGINQEQLRAWIDYNNDGVFNNATEQITFTNSILTSSPSVSASFTIPATATLNTMLRMRVIDDASTVYYGVPSISSGCTNPVYGQAEDYPVYITASGVLPVVLNKFTGVLKNSTAVLSWNASIEDNLKNFEIEKSIDGREFIKIGTVNAQKNTASTNDYLFIDINLSENNYYRLRINENNGETKLSESIFLHYGDLRQQVFVVNNPFSSYIEMSFAKGGSVSKLQLFNSLGAIVAEKTITSQPGRVRWDLPQNLSSGGYVFKVVVDDQMFTFKVVKQ